MAETLLEPIPVNERPDISQLITEDDTPVDNIFSEKQQRLLVETLYLSWKPDLPFVAAANVGIFTSVHQPPIVPDMFLSLDVQVAENLWVKEHRSYFLWEFDKPPEVVVEIVSNTKGGETDKKFHKYSRMQVWYYIIFDPQQIIQKDILCIYELSLGQYIQKQGQYLEQIDLGLVLWEGTFEGTHERWLRWCNEEGQLIPTGAELAEQERQRAERLAAQLRTLGIEPDEEEKPL